LMDVLGNCLIKGRLVRNMPLLGGDWLPYDQSEQQGDHKSLDSFHGHLRGGSARAWVA
jgi:hypothetical protein